MAHAHSCIQYVHSFEELLSTPFAAGVNALCWERSLPGDFEEVIAQLVGDAGINRLSEAQLRELSVSPDGQLAINAMLEDLRLLQQQGLAPELNCITAYPRDEEPGPVATDVFSFHADSAPIEASTWLCTYHGAPSEGLGSDEATKKVDVPEIRAELLKLYGGKDDDDFRVFLAENCYDLHYAPTPAARPYSFGTGHLWRIAVDWPGSGVPPCVHRAPATVAGEPRLLLIS
jgi:hypothetical protein